MRPTEHETEELAEAVVCEPNGEKVAVASYEYLFEVARTDGLALSDDVDHHE